MKAIILFMKSIAATALLCVTGFCMFGFLASFEAGWFSLWHCFYAICGIGSLTGAMHLLLCRTLAQTIGCLALFIGTMICLLGLMDFYQLRFPWQVVGGGAIGCGLLTGGVALLSRRGDNHKPVGALTLFAIVMFCVLGFIESCLGASWPFWVGYAAIGCGSLAGGVALLRRRETA